MTTRISPGTVHKLPKDLREALLTDSKVLALWEDITPLARNEFICWVENAKQIETRQRRVKPETRKSLAEGRRSVRTRYGVDAEVCTGDHSCIRLSGCPSLTIKDTTDPLRRDPVAHVNNDCVGCGLCGEVADAAILCPSFYSADIVSHPNGWDRLLARLRERYIVTLQTWAGHRPAQPSQARAAVPAE